MKKNTIGTALLCTCEQNAVWCWK